MAFIQFNFPKKSKKKTGTMNVILALIGISAAAFTAVMIWLFIQQGSVPDTLITCFFAFVGGECGIMGLIKTAKTKHETKKDKENEEVQG